MFKKHTYLLFLFVFTKSIGQETLKGKIISVIDNFKEVFVVNQTRNTFTNIDIDGQFEIDVFLNDTIKISSNSYLEESFIVTKIHINTLNEIHLKEKVEKLNEIVIDSYIINEEELAKINLKSQNQLKNDIEKNPYKYEIPDSKGNLLNLFPLVIQLLKKKEVKIETIPIKHKDLINYFKNDHSFLIEDLNIPKEQILYFFLFIEDQKISTDLLDYSNEFYFYEKLIHISSEFLKK